jgi:thermostable hemolysin
MDAAPARREKLPWFSVGIEKARDAAFRLQILDRAHADRASLEAFIAESYAKIYGARLTHYADHLVGLRDAAGAWTAGLGYTPATQAPLFIEQYLDQRVEDEIASILNVGIERDQIVEVGNLAATASGAARHIIVSMTALLHELNRTWVVFTSTRSLLNSFDRLRIPTITLANADPARLPDGGSNWGSYYESDPQVMTANIPLGLIHLRSRHAAPRRA